MIAIPLSFLSKLERVLEDKQKRIDTVRKGLEILQTSCVVWSNSASEVLLTGSFDGWTSQVCLFQQFQLIIISYHRFFVIYP